MTLDNVRHADDISETDVKKSMTEKLNHEI